MICYRDRWFCESHKTCKLGNTCTRALTDKVREDVRKWWGDNSSVVPIATVEKPECYINKTKNIEL